jgi:hypothetical protein
MATATHPQMAGASFIARKRDILSGCHSSPQTGIFRAFGGFPEVNRFFLLAVLIIPPGGIPGSRKAFSYSVDETNSDVISDGPPIPEIRHRGHSG